jgi:hypothetical protein
MQYSPCFDAKARGILCFVVNTFVIELKNNAYFYVILHKIFLALCRGNKNASNIIGYLYYEEIKNFIYSALRIV